MASLEERELVDYAVKKFENLVKETNKFNAREELDKLWSRVGKIEERTRKIINRMGNMERRLRLVETDESNGSLD